MRKVLIANRGEIAVRVARACRDAGLGSVAVYAEPDLDALHARMADEAYALGGSTSQETYLDIDKIIKVAVESGADAVHPGYGFLAENAEFARAVDGGRADLDRPPAGGHRGARGQGPGPAHRAGGRGAAHPGHPGPGPGCREVLAFAREYGYPVAIKAAFGGGGRGLKVAWREEEVADRYESAVREATAAFGRGECFVERYLDRPRHVETQCLADAHGHVVVISTRDCSLQRRHQKLVEEAPAPFLTAEQTETLYRSSKDILRRAGYVGAGTCEFLVGQDGTISFLEVNTRLQVEHPVSEEVTGIDLVREMFRIAEGEPLGYDDPPARGHSIEFRINAEDPGRNFLPAPGTITAWNPPSGPGVRLDAGYAAGMTVPQAYDSLIAKLIVTGASRAAGTAALGPRAGRVRGRRDADRAALPPGRGGRPRVRRRAAAGAHPLDRDRVRHADAGPGDGRGRRAGRAGAADRRGGREAAGGGRAGRPGPWYSSSGGRTGPGFASRRRAICASWWWRDSGQPDAGHDHQDRGREGQRVSPATLSWCSRR